MTLGMAIGYDWLYGKLSAASCKTIAEAISKKGVRTSLDPKNNGWLRVIATTGTRCAIPA